MYNQRAISFPPLGNPWILGLASAEVLRSDQVDELELLLGSAGWADPDAEIPAPVLQWCAAVSQANSEYFRFRLDGVLEPGEPTLRRVGAGESLTGLGLDRERSTRKLVSLLVLAVEGVGVGFRMEETGSEVASLRGSFVTFPAYAHVSCSGPPGSAVRVLVAHAVGPAFS